MDTLGNRMKEARARRGMSQARLAKLLGLGQSTIASIENGRNRGSGSLVQIAAALAVSPLWLAEGKGPPDADPAAALGAQLSTGRVYHVPIVPAPASCGGGGRSSQPVGEYLVKDASFFTKRKLNPASAIAIQADGDAMADFIVDGDVVVFDTSRRDLETGRIFLIEHPAGLRIRQMRRDIDGSWVVGNRNPDKVRFPDERIAEDSTDRLKLLGTFVYREG
jgi:transcriptional regulator with XRE-family HTH domain